MSKSGFIDYNSQNRSFSHRLALWFARIYKTIMPLSLTALVIASFCLAIVLNLVEPATKKVMAESFYVKDVNGDCSDIGAATGQPISEGGKIKIGANKVEIDSQANITIYKDNQCTEVYATVKNSALASPSASAISATSAYANVVDYEKFKNGLTVDAIADAIGNGMATPAELKGETIQELSTYDYEINGSKLTLKPKGSTGPELIFSGLSISRSDGGVANRILVRLVDDDSANSLPVGVILIPTDKTKGTVTAVAPSEFNYGESGQGSTDDSSSDNADEMTSCTKAAHGWGSVLCGLGELVYTGVNALYNFVDGLLVINTDVFSIQATNSGAHRTWSIFRNIANVLFIIYLLVMIFSQITGIGISNYGIKKNLPRVIAASILLNVSYYLCIVASDLSNIIGASIKSLLDSISSSITPMAGNAFIEASVSDAPNKWGDIAKGLGFAAFIGLAFTLTEATAAKQSGWMRAFSTAGTSLLSSILMLFVSILIVAFVTLFGMVLVLTLRQALVVLMIAAAPLAILAYTLPNTKNLFNLWWKISKALILLYPICGFVVGVGNLASSVILSVGNGFVELMISLIAQIGPYFMVPTIFKGTLAAVGNVNAKINGITGVVQKTADTTLRENRFGQIVNDRAGRIGNMIKQSRNIHFEASKFAVDSKDAQAQEAALLKSEAKKAARSKPKTLNRADSIALARAQSNAKRAKQTLANERAAQYAVNDLRNGQDNNKAAYFTRLVELANKKDSLAPQEEVEMMSLIQHTATTSGLDGDFQGLIAGREVDSRRLNPGAIKRIYDMQLNLPSNVNSEINKQGSAYFYLSQTFAGKGPSDKVHIGSNDYTYAEAIEHSMLSPSDRDFDEDKQKEIWRTAYAAMIKGKVNGLLDQDSKNLEYFLKYMTPEERASFGDRLAQSPSMVSGLSDSKVAALRGLTKEHVNDPIGTGLYDGDIWGKVKAAEAHAQGRTI